MGIFVTGIVTGYFGVEICHGLVGVSRVSFSVFVTGYQKNVTGKKNDKGSQPANYYVLVHVKLRAFTMSDG